MTGSTPRVKPAVSRGLPPSGKHLAGAFQIAAGILVPRVERHGALELGNGFGHSAGIGQGVVNRRLPSSRKHLASAFQIATGILVRRVKRHGALEFGNGFGHSAGIGQSVANRSLPPSSNHLSGAFQIAVSIPAGLTATARSNSGMGSAIRPTSARV